jgi:uncharacterized protein
MAKSLVNSKYNFENTSFFRGAMNREHYLQEITDQFKIHHVCAILGPRQVGKTTLAKLFAEKHQSSPIHVFDLEDPQDLIKLENPMIVLEPLVTTKSLIIIDEIQLRPNLFPILRVLVDRHPGKFLILGSASRDLIHQSSETLAGRIGYIELTPFSIEETQEISKLWIRGGFPRSYLAKNNAESFNWRTAYIKTFLERDIPSFGITIPPQQIRRFWLMICHYHGQIFNASEIGRSLSISDHTARRYLDILAGTFMVRELQPWFENISKRQVKSPKIYFRDSGILNALVGIHDNTELQSYPKIGVFWEGFALEEIIRKYQATPEDCYFWATQAGAELDLLLIKDGKRLGFEFKYADAPKTTISMHTALADLKLNHLYVVYPGKDVFPMKENITAMGLESLIKKR